MRRRRLAAYRSVPLQTLQFAPIENYSRFRVSEVHIFVGAHRRAPFLSVCFTKLQIALRANKQIKGLIEADLVSAIYFPFL
ncbi:MAG TPA: hypothetical protein V6D11_14245 [Waterburya sp.]